MVRSQVWKVLNHEKVKGRITLFSLCGHNMLWLVRFKITSLYMAITDWFVSLRISHSPPHLTSFASWELCQNNLCQSSLPQTWKMNLLLATWWVKEVCVDQNKRKKKMPWWINRTIPILQPNIQQYGKKERGWTKKQKRNQRPRRSSRKLKERHLTNSPDCREWGNSGSASPRGRGNLWPWRLFGRTRTAMETRPF